MARSGQEPLEQEYPFRAEVETRYATAHVAPQVALVHIAALQHLNSPVVRRHIEYDRPDLLFVTTRDELVAVIDDCPLNLLCSSICQLLHERDFSLIVSLMLTSLHYLE